MGLKVLLTGHKGYIGHILRERLVNEGHTVLGIDTDYFKKHTPLPARNFTEKIMDIREIGPADLKGIDAVIHLAAISSDSSSKISPVSTIDINASTTKRLARLAKEQGVKRFIFSSTVGIYGSHPDNELCTEATPPDPLTPYSLSKLQGEERVAELADENFSPVFLRNATVYGWSPRMRCDAPINSFIYGAITSNTVTLKTDGLAWRSIIHVDDLSRAFTMVLGAPRDLIHNQVFNLGVTRENYRLKDVANVAVKMVPGATLEVGKKPASSTCKVDFSKFEKTFGFTNKWSLEEGYAEIIKHGEEMKGPVTEYSNYRAMIALREQDLIDNSFRWTKKG